jgi:hypothetical protein
MLSLRYAAGAAVGMQAAVTVRSKLGTGTWGVRPASWLLIPAAALAAATQPLVGPW